MDKELKKNKNFFGVEPYQQIKIFKNLLLQIWYRLIDRGIDEALNDRISFKNFAGFDIDAKTPDHSTICRFSNNLFEEELYKKIFKMINKQLESSRKPRKTISSKSNKENNINKIDQDNIIYSDDTEASCTYKAKKIFVWL